MLRIVFLAGFVLCGTLSANAQQPSRYGPKDGAALPASDLERVKVGSNAPDFTLESLSGQGVTLSGFRGKKNVVLVFYRGHW
jgi:cytochrome oxidase Cu insertion factor (SCO1/SenC/PrrC family)